MEFNLYKFAETDIYRKWVRFTATVLGLTPEGIPFVDLWRQERKVFKDENSTVVNTDLGKISVTLPEIGDPTTVSFDLLHPVSGEVIGTTNVGEYIAASYSFGIWLDKRQEQLNQPVEPETTTTTTPAPEPVV